MRRPSGFTLIELMMVITILGVLVALAVASFDSLRARTGPRNAAADLSSALSLARNRALDRGSDVWFIIYPDYETNGAWYIYEDIKVAFGGAASPADGGILLFSDFEPPNDIYPLGTESGNRLIDSGELRLYPRSTTRFVADAGVPWGVPFAALNTNATPECTFCTPGGPGGHQRGAIVFTGDGSVRFVDGDGNALMDRAAGFSIGGADDARQGTRFAVSRATGHAGVFQQ